ncbi:alpha/beta fold hydrolase [Shimia abyssi]|uniref:DNA-binding winged helix-turn-helix (WHTH) protein n=1 Tax=Shimia abyssi TaxID=1662395 RepID=A0A2P8F7V0_9RHOB|nr:alpha/beta fold hydrolase [Shimia abyssi]PSL17799.1 DNA-binding winged helix-turn-helix (wHTH) protein [Shimia abyssi]
MIDPIVKEDSVRAMQKYKFGGFVLDPEQHSLMHSGAPVSIEPKVFDLLLLLVKNAGELISRDTLIERIWQGRIVSDSAISACVAAARRAVGDDGQSQAVIRTVARRGFLCCAEVEVVETADEAQSRELSPRLQFTKNREDKSLAFTVTGEGPPIIYKTFGGTSIEADWNSPFFRPLLDAIRAKNTLVRFDEMGSGHSDLEMNPDRVEAVAYDLLSVADAIGLDRFSLFSQSGSALSAVFLAAHYPDRVQSMVLNGGYVEGRNVRQNTTGTPEMLGMISEGWDKPDSSFLLAYSLLYFPEGPLDLAKDIVEIMHKSCPAENMLRMRKSHSDASVADFLPMVQCPTFIVHARNDSIHPLSQARKLAAGIAGSELLVLDSANHVPMPKSPDWNAFLEATLSFLNGNMDHFR